MAIWFEENQLDLLMARRPDSEMDSMLANFSAGREFTGDCRGSRHLAHPLLDSWEIKLKVQLPYRMARSATGVSPRNRREWTVLNGRYGIASN